MNDVSSILRERLEKYPELLPKVFAFAPERVRELAEAGHLESVMARLNAAEARKYLDRLVYVAKTRIEPKQSKKPDQCNGKNTYLSEEFANRKANKAWEAGRGKMRVYHCHLCKGWHLTHKPKT